MAVPTTAVFKLTFDEILDAAQNRLGGEQMSGYEGRVARRAYQIMEAHWANLGIQMWAITPFTTTLLEDQQTFTMPADCVDVANVNCVMTTGNPQTQVTMVQVGRDQWFGIAMKLAKGAPNQYFVDRQRDTVTLHFYPVPNREYDIVGYYRRRLKDVDNFTDDLDIPFRYTEAAIAGLAYYMSKENPKIDSAKRAELKADYEYVLQQAMDGDADKSPWYVAPDLSMYMGGWY